MSPFITLSAAVVMAIGGYFYGVSITDTKWKAETETQINKAVAEARSDEQKKQKAINDDLQIQFNEINSINASLNTDIDSLRKRKSRANVPRNTSTDCKNATGASLLSEDAVFLRREASRADKLRTALKTCYKYADTITANQK